LLTPEQQVSFDDVHCILLSTQSAPLLPECVKVIVAPGSSLEALESAVRTTPERTAVLLVRVEEVWAGVANRGGPTMESWTNPGGLMTTPIGRIEESLKATLKTLHSLAKERNITIVATSKLATKSWDRLEPALTGLKNLLWYNLHDGKEHLSDDWLIESVSQMKEGILSMTELRQLLEQDLLDVRTLETSWAQALSAAGLHYEAWELMKSFASEFGKDETSTMIRLAQMAADAADADSALGWIKNARVAGIRVYQDWCCAVRLSQVLGEKNLEQSLMEEMALHFPHTEAVLDWQMRIALLSGDPGAAAAFARRMGNELRAVLLEEIASGKLVTPEIQKRNLAPDDMAFALQSLANFLVKRGNLLGGFRAASVVPKGTNQEIPSLRVRWKTLGALVVADGDAADEHVELLNALIIDTVPHSNNLGLRRLIDDVCVDEITPSAHLVLFTTLANQLLYLVRNLTAQKPWRGPAFDETLDVPTSEIVPFIESLLGSQPSKILALGRTTLPNSIVDQASPGMVTALIRAMDTVEPKPAESEPWMMMLMGIECIAKHLGDPTTDMLAAQWLVRRTAAIGDGQTARNMAEGILLNLPKAQPSEMRWRVGIAWLTMAEARVSSGSPNEAMRYLCFALCCFTEGVRHVEIIAEAFNLAARAMRDLGISPLASEALRVEAELSSQYADVYREEKAFDTKAMLELHQLSSAPTASIARYLHRQMKRLRSMNESADLGPILSCIGNAIRFLRGRGVTLGDNMQNEISYCMETFRRRHPERVKILDGMLAWPPQRQWFIEQVKNTSLALRSEDMDGQLAKLSIIARDSFIHSCDVHDFEFALTTAALLCQPALMVRAAARAIAQDRVGLELRQYLAAREPCNLDSAQAEDALKLIEHRSQPRLHTLESTLAISVDELRAALREDEGVLILIHTNHDSNPLATLYIDRLVVMTSHCHLTLEQNWTQGALARWDNALHMRSQISDLSDRTPDDMLQAHAAEFALHVHTRPSKLCIIPESDLFGFPFAMIPLLETSAASASHSEVGLHNSGFRLGEIVVLSTAPSVEQFIQKRRRVRVPSGQWMAWSGKPLNADDRALRLVGEHLPQTLAGLNCELTIGGSPPDFDAADLGVMILHGQPNSWGELVALKQGDNHFVPEELGSLVGRCGCFILGACYGSSGSTIAGSRECWGAVSSALAAGATCVIAPCFAVNADFLLEWIGQFLRQFATGVSVATAADRVNRVQLRLAGRIIMQVFGDGSFQLEPRALDKE
jgi:hypothetical protein